MNRLYQKQPVTLGVECYDVRKTVMCQFEEMEFFEALSV